MTRATTFRATAVIGGVLLAMMMIMTVSRAAFSDVTSYDDSAFATGTVVLNSGGASNPFATDENGGAIFTATNAKPGDTATGCVEIIYDGTIDALVELDSVTVVTDPDVLAAVLDLEINRYTDSSCSTLDDTVSTAGDTLDNWNDSETAWPASTGDRLWYGVTVTLQDVDNSYQGLAAADIEFEWIANQA